MHLPIHDLSHGKYSANDLIVPNRIMTLMCACFAPGLPAKIVRSNGSGLLIWGRSALLVLVANGCRQTSQT